MYIETPLLRVSQEGPPWKRGAPARSRRVDVDQSFQRGVKEPRWPEKHRSEQWLAEGHWLSQGGGQKRK